MVWNVLVSYLKSLKFEAFSSLPSPKFNIKGEYLDRWMNLMQRQLFQSEKQLFSLCLKDTLTLCIQYQREGVMEDHIDKYVKLFGKLCNNNSEIKVLFWQNEIYQNKGFGALFGYL